MMLKLTINELNDSEKERILTLIRFNREVEDLLFKCATEENKGLLENYTRFCKFGVESINGNRIAVNGVTTHYTRTSIRVAVQEIHRVYKKYGWGSKAKTWRVQGSLTKMEDDDREGYNYLCIKNIPKINVMDTDRLCINLGEYVTIPKDKVVWSIRVKYEYGALYVYIKFKAREVKDKYRIRVTNRCYGYRYLLTLSNLPWIVTTQVIDKVRYVKLSNLYRNKTYKPLYRQIVNMIEPIKVDTIDGVVRKVCEKTHAYIITNRKVPDVGNLKIDNVEIYIKEIVRDGINTDIGNIGGLHILEELVGVTDCIGILKRQGKKLWIEIKTQ